MRFVVFVMLAILVNSLVSADGSISVKKGPLDQATLNVEEIKNDAPLHVHLFDTTGVKLGKVKHQDTAQLMVGTAPHLLAVDIVEGLRDAGFNKVILEETIATKASLNPGELALLGNFTELNPGSQATRMWVGLGAGKSKVCVKGSLIDSNGNSLGEFNDCRSGLGWGESTDVMGNSTKSIGDDIAKLLINWSHGNYISK